MEKRKVVKRGKWRKGRGKEGKWRKGRGKEEKMCSCLSI